MIDFESIVIDRVFRAVNEAFPGTTVLGQLVPVPAKLPCVMVYETQNAVVPELMSADRIERYADVSYRVIIYTSESGRKAKANAILSVVDDALSRIVEDAEIGTAAGLNRYSKSYSFGLNESELCCITANYSGRVSESPNGETFTIYRR